MKKTTFLLMSATALLASAACTKVQDSPVGNESQNNAACAIGFETFTHKTTKAFVENITTAQGGKRRYALTAYLKPFSGKDSAYIDREPFGYDINPEFPRQWNTETTHYWPTTAIGAKTTSTLNFFVYGPQESGIIYDRNGYVTGGETYPKLTVTVNDTCESQKDMLAAMSEYETYQQSGVSIAFNHILSAVSFTATAEADTLEYIIKGIKVGVAFDDTTTGKLYPSGIYTFARLNAKGTWSDRTGTMRSYALGLSDSLTVRSGKFTNLTALDGILMLIPQELEQAGAYFAITYDIYDKATGVRKVHDVTKFGTLHATSLKEWKTGIKYNYCVTIPADEFKPITYTVTINDWTEQDVVISESEDVYSDDQPESIRNNGDDFGKTEW